MDKDVRADYMVRGLLGKGGFSLVKEGVSEMSRSLTAVLHFDTTLFAVSPVAQQYVLQESFNIL